MCAHGDQVPGGLGGQLPNPYGQDGRPGGISPGSHSAPQSHSYNN